MLREIEKAEGLTLSRRSALKLLMLASATMFIPASSRLTPRLPKPPFNPLIDTKAIQDKYVGEILDIEDTFDKKPIEIGSPAIRKHTELVAGMFTEYYNIKDPTDELAGNVLLMPTTREFLIYLRQTGNLPKEISEREVRNLVAQYTKQGKAVVNLGHEFFNPTFLEKTARLGLIPSAWNPLRELRIIQTHEWGHNTGENTTDPLLGLIDPKNRYPDKGFSGFRLEGFGDITEGAYLEDVPTRIRYSELDEAAVEAISASPNVTLFPQGKDFYSSYPDFHGNPQGITKMGVRLKKVRDAARVNPLTLYKRHANSEPERFFYLILKRAGLEPEDPRLTLIQIRDLIDTIITGNPEGMQRYIAGAYKYTPG